MPEFGYNTIEFVKESFFDETVSDREQDKVALVSVMRMLSVVC